MKLRSAVTLKRTALKLSPYATVLVAYFFRVYRLADKNVWWDEGWSLWLARQDPVWIALRTAADEHPPLHYWMLSVWNGVMTGLAGLGQASNAVAGQTLNAIGGLVVSAVAGPALSAVEGAFLGRFLSVAFGVLTIALIYRLGKRVGGTWIGVLAALFLALARFHIWWSQDVKNYTPSIFFAFLALWFALDLLDRPSRNAIVGYAVAAALALWTHYLAALILLAVNVYALLVFVVRFARAGASGPRTSVILSGAKNLPRRHGSSTTRGEILRSAQNDNTHPHYDNTHPHYDNARAHNDNACSSLISSLAHRLIGSLTHWPVGSLISWFIAQTLALALFAPWLYLYLSEAATWSAAPTFDLGLFLQLVATVLPLGITTHIEDYGAITVLMTAFATLGAVGAILVRHKWSRGGLFALIVLIPPLLIYLLSLTPAAFFAPKIQARYLLILLPAYSILLALGVMALRRFSLYVALAATIAVVGINLWVLGDYYSTRRLSDEYATLANTLNAFAQPNDLVLLNTDQEWPTFLYYLRASTDWLGVPNGAPMTVESADLLVRRALNRHSAVWVVSIPDALATDPQQLLQARLGRDLPKQFERSFGDKRLELYGAAARDLASVPRANFAPQRNRTETIGTAQLLGFDLPVREARVGDTVRLVTYWNAPKEQDVAVELRKVATGVAHISRGERVRVETDLTVSPNAVGEIPLALGSMELGRVRVEPRAAAAFAGTISHPVKFRFGDAIQLVGYDLPRNEFKTGEQVPVTLYWQADAAVPKSYIVFVHLLGADANLNHNPPNLLWGQIDRVPVDGAAPTSVWRPHETIADSYRVPIEAGAPAGMYKIEVGLYDPANGERLALNGAGDSLWLAEVEVMESK